MKPLAYIIEDDYRLSDIFSETIKAAGYEVEAITDGQVAMDKLKAVDRPPDLVLLDLHLPHVKGDVILKSIRRDSRFEQTRIMLVTADGNMANTLEQESDLVLLKPISAIQLRQLAQRLQTPRL